MTIDSLLLWFIGFINNAVMPLLFAIALAIFVYNVVRYFVVGGGNEEERKKAQSYALYSILAFVLMVSIWGIVNLVVGGIGLGRSQIVCPDYLPYNVCSRNIQAPPIPEVDERHVPASPSDSDYDSSFPTPQPDPIPTERPPQETLPGCEADQDPSDGECDPTLPPPSRDPENCPDCETDLPLPPCGPDDDPLSGDCEPVTPPDLPDEPTTPIPETLTVAQAIATDDEFQELFESCRADGGGRLLVSGVDSSYENVSCVTAESATGLTEAGADNLTFEVLPLSNVFPSTDPIYVNHGTVEVADVIGYLEYDIYEGTIACSNYNDCVENVFRPQCEETQGGRLFDYQIDHQYPLGAVGMICVR